MLSLLIPNILKVLIDHITQYEGLYKNRDVSNTLQMYINQTHICTRSKAFQIHLFKIHNSNELQIFTLDTNIFH